MLIPLWPPSSSHRLNPASIAWLLARGLFPLFLTTPFLPAVRDLGGTPPYIFLNAASVPQEETTSSGLLKCLFLGLKSNNHQLGRHGLTGANELVPGLRLTALQGGASIGIF